MDALDRLAERCGIEAGYWDNDGNWHITGVETKRALIRAMGLDDAHPEAALIGLAQPAAEPTLVVRAGDRPVLPVGFAGDRKRFAMTLEAGAEVAGVVESEGAAFVLPCALPEGYHRLTLEGGDDPRRMRVIAVPVHAPTPVDLAIARSWGITCQAYGLRPAVDRGVGDFGAIAELAMRAGADGASFLGLQPLHALFGARPGIYSPYQPSNRRFLNTQMIDIDAAASLFEVEADPIDRHDPALIDYGAVAPAKLSTLRRIYEAVRGRSDGVTMPAATAFAAWRQEQGPPLEAHARFETIDALLTAQGDGPATWRHWPDGLATSDGPAVAEIALEHAAEVDFHAWLQWLADVQLGAAQQRARDSGMRLGLYRDLAIGVSPEGSAAWSEAAVRLREVSIGAPPDAFSPNGQVWGIAPFSPPGLEATGFDGFIADLRANMRHAGALRIDHAMGLKRLFWVPEGGTPSDGAYVRYPFDALRGILALEARRAGCLVIGEDLGTVPEGFRDAIHDSGVLSCSVLWFERNWDGDGSFKAPEDVPAEALATLSTHDLPTARGFLAGSDIEWRLRAGVLDAEQARAAHEVRANEIARLLDALFAAGALPAGAEADREAVVAGLHRYLAKGAAALVGVQLEDLAGELEQANLPGTVFEHPNWRRRMPATAAELLARPSARAIIAAMTAERGQRG